MQGFEAEGARQEARAASRASGADQAYRFRLQPGEAAEIVVLDVSFDDMAAFHEHNLYNPATKSGDFEGCPKEWEICPLCETHKESYYVLCASILDLRGYVRKGQNGQPGEKIPVVRRVLAIKTSSAPKFLQLFAAATEQFGTVRGMYMYLQRPKDGQSPNIGEPGLLTNNTLFHMFSEEELYANYGHPAVMGRDGVTVLKEENADLQPFDYDAIFPTPSADDLRQRYNVNAVPGSAQSAVDAWETGQEQVAPAPGVRTRPGPAQQAPPRPAGGAPRPAGAPGAPRPATAPVARPQAAPAARPMAPRTAQPAQPMRPMQPHAAAPVARARTRPAAPAPVAQPAAEADPFGGEGDEYQQPDPNDPNAYADANEDDIPY